MVFPSPSGHGSQHLYYLARLGSNYPLNNMLKKLINKILNKMFPYRPPCGVVYEFSADDKSWVDRLSNNGQIDRLLVNNERVM